MEELHWLKDLLWQWLEDVSKQPGFGAGVCVGVLFVAVLGYIFFTFRVWWGQVSAPYRPQTITQTFTTKDTPAQVMNRSLRAILVGFGIMACAICMLAEVLVPGIVETVIQNVVP